MKNYIQTTFLIFFLSFLTFLTNGQTVSTFAGSGTAGYTDGPATTAEFNDPDNVAVDAAGNVYVAEYYNDVIRKITPAGVVTTYAGNGNTGYTNGPAATAEFNSPYAVAVDANGNVYVADAGNDVIRKIDATGMVSTLAGSGVAGYTDGSATTAQFDEPNDVAVDAAGNVYVPEWNNEVIRKITSAGVVSTYAGTGIPGLTNGPAATAQFNSPKSVAVDAAGNVYVAEVGNHVIRKIDAAGMVSTLAGSGTAGFADGTATSAQFDAPRGIAVNSAAVVFVADRGNTRIRRITATGVVSTYAGNGTTGLTNGVASAAEFDGPKSVAVDAAGNVYVADAQNNVIRKISVAYPAGLNLLSKLNGNLVIYPNPANDQINMQATFSTAVELGINVMDLQGRILQQTTHTVQKGENIFQISLVNLPAANYLFQFTEDGVHTRSAKIMKQ